MCLSCGTVGVSVLYCGTVGVSVFYCGTDEVCLVAGQVVCRTLFCNNVFVI